jgi:hypothetical protein
MRWLFRATLLLAVVVVGAAVAPEALALLVFVAVAFGGRFVLPVWAVARVVRALERRR